MNMDADDIVLERPVIATLLVALVAAIAYVGIQLLLDGSVAPAETASFVLIFTIIYVAGNRFLRERPQSDTEPGADTDPGADTELDAGTAPADESTGETPSTDATDSPAGDPPT